MPTWTRDHVAQLVDHTLLKPEANETDVAFLVHEASELGVYAVCVSPSLVSAARGAGALDLAIASVVGFPSGKHVSTIKAQEARLAVESGAEEVDMVIDVGAAVAGDFAAVRADIAAVREAVPDVVLKVIVESAALLDLVGEQTLVDVCRAAVEAQARLRQDLDGVSSRGRCVRAGRGGHGRDRRTEHRGQGQRRHPHCCRRARNARRRCDETRAVGDPRRARRIVLAPRLNCRPHGGLQSGEAGILVGGGNGGVSGGELGDDTRVGDLDTVGMNAQRIPLGAAAC